MNSFDKFDRRTVLKTAGAGLAAGSVLPGAASANNRSKGKKQHLDPLWGYTGLVEPPEEEGEQLEFPSLKSFPPQMRPDHLVKLHVGFEFGGQELPALHFHPTGLHVEPGDVVMFQLHSPDHTVTAYHMEIRFGQRVPEDAEPFSSPVLPKGGYWLYRFDEAGVYDLFCSPHEFWGMVMRIVAYDEEEDGEVPDGYGPKVKGPAPFNLLNNLEALGLGKNPPFHIPSSLEALTSDALTPSNIVSEEKVHYEEVFEEYNP